MNFTIEYHSNVQRHQIKRNKWIRSALICVSWWVLFGLWTSIHKYANDKTKCMQTFHIALLSSKYSRLIQTLNENDENFLENSVFYVCIHVHSSNVHPKIPFRLFGKRVRKYSPISTWWCHLEFKTIPNSSSTATAK